MTVVVEGYTHRTGEHCASTALRNLLAHQGTELSEAMVFGLSSGLGFYYVKSDGLSPTRMFHGRSISLESDFGRNTGVPLVDRAEPDDQRAWLAVRERIDRGRPVMVSTDTFYLPYHKTTSHFPGHRCVVVGYDEASESVLIADRKFDTYQRCSLDELRRARNADDYPMRCHNGYGEFLGEVKLQRSPELVRLALRRNADWMLAPSASGLTGIDAMRALASDLPGWQQLDDWSWSARFGYQVVVKRGAGGSFFRSLYADFLREAAELLPEIGSAGLPEQMDAIAAGWRGFARVMQEQSERGACDPALFAHAATRVSELADLEESFFLKVGELAGTRTATPAIDSH